MKRNLKLILKYILLISLTVCITSILFHFTRMLQGNNDSLLFTNDNLHHTTTAGNGNDKFQKLNWHDRANDKFQKIDWHDHYQIEMDKIRTGNGEQGKPAKLPENYNGTVEKYLFSVNGFNGMLSDMIALNRSIPDIRHPGCKTKKYSRILPTVSVVVPFHNEHFSTLLRTAYSVLNRSPPQLLMEIILVDDYSSKDETKQKLDDYVRDHFTKVRVVRLTSRQGLIRARLAGARNATGDVLLFLDSHTEANVNWLPPLLEPIAEDYKTCVCPFIDVVAYDTFEYRAQDEGARGAFDWEFYYKRLPLLPEDKERPTEPFKSPVMAGGLFAISSKFFWELGGYDPGLDIWGGEQYELSFKIWLCGGRMFDAPCSRVGHIYRKFAPFPNPGIGDFIAKNYRRVAEVWMDEYAEYIYKRRPHYRTVDPGNLDEQFAIKNKLKCKPFKWFMENVAFDLVKVYPPIEPPDLADGKIKNFVNQNHCAVVVDEDKPLKIRNCDSNDQDKEFKLTWHKDIRVKTKTTKCLDVASPGKRAKITLYSCHGMQGNQLWKYNPDTKWLVHGGNPRCLEYDVKDMSLFVSKCDKHSDAQKWIWDNQNTELLSNQ